MTRRFKAAAPREAPLNEPTYLKIKKAIIADIVAGQFRPGDHLTIDMLTGRYGVSHMPIREALRQLEGEGILVSIAHRGFRLEEITETYIRNIYDIRVGIESLLARRAVEHAMVADIDELAAIHTLFCDQILRSDPEATETNFLFHARLYALARNPEAASRK
jgi:DNA-binding GntR family transcriptional regulator